MSTSTTTDKLIGSKELAELRLFLEEHNHAEQNKKFWKEVFYEKLIELNINVGSADFFSNIYKVAKVNDFFVIYFCNMHGNPYESQSCGMPHMASNHVIWSGDITNLLSAIYLTKNVVCFGGGRKHSVAEPGDFYFHICPLIFGPDAREVYHTGRESVSEEMLVAEKQWSLLLATKKNFSELKSEYLLEIKRIEQKILVFNSAIEALSEETERLTAQFYRDTFL